MLSSWPLLAKDNLLPQDPQAEQLFASFQGLVRAVRNARSQYNVEVGRKISVILKIDKPAFREVMKAEAAVFCFVTRSDEQTLRILEGSDSRPAENCVQLVVEEGVEAFLPQDSLIDRVKELQRLQKQKEKLQKERQGLQTRIDSPGFADRAPPAVVQQVRDTLRDLTEQLRVLEESISALS